MPLSGNFLQHAQKLLVTGTTNGNFHIPVEVFNKRTTTQNIK